MSAFNADAMNEEKGRRLANACNYQEEKASLLGWEAGWSEWGSAEYRREQNREIELSGYRESERGTNGAAFREGLENPEILDRCANPEDRPFGGDAKTMRNGNPLAERIVRAKRDKNSQT